MRQGLGLFWGSALLAALSLPLALGLLRPNRFYGLRPVRCPENSDAWRRLNAFAGRVFLGVAAVGLLMGRMPEYLTSERQVGYFIVLLLGAAGAVWARARLEGRGV